MFEVGLTAAFLMTIVMLGVAAIDQLFFAEYAMYAYKGVELSRFDQVLRDAGIRPPRGAMEHYDERKDETRHHVLSLVIPYLIAIALWWVAGLSYDASSTLGFGVNQPLTIALIVFSALAIAATAFAASLMIQSIVKYRDQRKLETPKVAAMHRAAA